VAPNPKENQMSFDFTGQRVLVAGGSRGIGRAIALNFAAAGAAVGVCARDSAALEAARADIARHGQPVHAMACDLADAASIAAWVPAAAEALGGIDVLVNNASGFGSSDDEAGWAASINVDLLGAVRATTQLLATGSLPWPPVQLLIVADAVYAIVSFLCFEYVLDE